MAASSSDESSRAPDNFCLSSNCETQNSCLKCCLCKRYNNNFICAKCVKTGSFFHSSHHLPEKLSEKQEKYIQLQNRSKNQNIECEKLIQKYRDRENLKFEIKKKQEKIAILNHLIKNTKEKISERKKYSDNLESNNNYQRNILPKYKDKVKNLEDYVSDRLTQIERLKGQKNDILEEVKIKTQAEIQKLVSYIFPISEIVVKEELSTTDSSSSGGLSDNHNTLNLDTGGSLSETKITSNRGKWILPSTAGSEMQYRIVAPSLPANGDYSAYLHWLAENKDEINNTICLLSMTTAAAHRILGALTYTTQLTNILSFYLNVRLPNKLAYADFTRRLNEQQFTRRVSRLNTNVMYLAYTQRVKLSSANENHTLENLLAIISTDNNNLGHVGPNQVNDAPSINSIDSILIGMDTGTESESEDENSLRLDWEAVSPSFSTTQEVPTQPIHPLQNPQTTSIMANAANSIASIFRGWRT
ncbi:beclin 1-associated autophagy-related key regulator [Condylostylus longicornis]|uniref:beclin 1-associated autophagy-related key regulator n=1 Tax=Condylostylus longicornis TaxID=2530218 RepID=UPI00244DC163|nr:beclin 1-associated autophagy-related key regulator [Condylostylus longicornis]